MQARGDLNCGVENVTVAGAVDFGRYVVDYCRAVASVVLGDPTAVNLVAVGDDRFARLQGREVDVLFAGDAHTLERDIREVSESEYTVSNIAPPLPMFAEEYANAAHFVRLRLHTSPRRAPPSGSVARITGPKWCTPVCPNSSYARQEGKGTANAGTWPSARTTLPRSDC